MTSMTATSGGGRPELDDEQREDLRQQFGDMICGLLTQGLTEAGYGIADIAVAEGLWPDRLQRPVYLHPTTDRPSFFDPASFWFVAHLERNWERIRREVDEVTDPKQSGFSSAGMDGSSVHGTGWRQLMLWDRGQRFDEACSRLPVTAEVVSAIPEATVGGNGFVMLSWLEPGTWIAPHCGPTNAKARTHLGVRVDPGAQIRVGEHVRSWEEGKAFTFDDSFEHEVWHRGSSPRVVLIVDTPHPFLVARDEVVRQDQSSRGEEIHSFMESMNIRRIRRRGTELTVDFADSMVDFMRSYMTTRGVESAELRDGNLHLS